MSTDTTRDSTRATVRCPFCLTWNRVDIARVDDHPRCGNCSRPILLDRPIKLDDETFERTVTGAGVPVLVDFYADWCGPCKVMAPVVDQLAAARRGRLLVAKLDTDRSPITAQKYGISGIPTLILFENGTEIRRQSGAMPLAGLEALVGG